MRTLKWSTKSSGLSSSRQELRSHVFEGNAGSNYIMSIRNRINLDVGYFYSLVPEIVRSKRTNNILKSKDYSNP
jgi:hypothetical protein